MRQKREAAIASLRQQRGIIDPKQGATDKTDPPKTTDEAPEETQAQPPTAQEPTTQSTQPKAQDLLQDDALQKRLADFDKKQQTLATQEQAIQKRIQDAEGKEADAQKRIKDLELALADPIDFMAKVGMTEAEFKAFLGQGGTLTAEQRRLREVEKNNKELRDKLDGLVKQQQQASQKMAEQMELAEFKGQLSDYQLVTRMGGINAVMQKRAQLQEQLGQPVSLKQTAEGLEKQFKQALSGLLQDEQIRTTFGLSTQSSPPGTQAAPPKTLNEKFANQTSPKGPQKPAWNDWAAKRALAIRAMQAQGRQ